MSSELTVSTEDSRRLARTVSGPKATHAQPAGGRRIPSLDGLRAVSICLVILSHLSDLSTRAGSRILDQVWRIDAGNLGVRVFFVISGFLITTLLLEEHARTGMIKLGRFYFRRTFRIMPAFYVFLAVMTVSQLAGWLQVGGPHLVHAATYTSDYLSTSWPVGHTWSLSVEEQFYLLWPGLLLLAGIGGGFWGALAALVLSPLFRLLAMHFGPEWPDNARYAFECVADALATGCLLARYRGHLWRSSRYRQFLGGGTAQSPRDGRLGQWVFVSVAALAVANVRWPFFGALVGITALNVAIALMIDWALRFPGVGVARLLNCLPVALIGTWSYSLYLWQQPFLAESFDFPIAGRLVLIAAASIASFYVIEKPMLRVRARLERRWFGRHTVQAHPAAASDPGTGVA